MKKYSLEIISFEKILLPKKFTIKQAYEIYENESLKGFKKDI